MIDAIKKTLILSLCFTGISCEQESPSVSFQHITTYGEKGVENTWPPQSNESITVASDLSAANYYIVVDGSGSMREEQCSNGRDKMVVAKQAVQNFIGSLPASSNVGLFGFDAYGASERHALNNTDRNDAKAQVARMTAGGGTPLGGSIRYAMAALAKQARSQLGYGEYHLVVVTDGVASDADLLNSAIDLTLTQSPIIIHTVGFCIGRNHTLNRSGYTLYHAADNPESLMAGLNSVLAEAPEFDTSTFAGDS